MAFIDTATRSQLIELYVAYFNRAPDADGLAYWSDKVANGGWTVATVARSFMDQTEVKSTYPDYMTSSEIVDKVYTNVLNRAADADGKTYWVNQLNTGKVTKADLIQAVVNAAKSTTGTATDAATLTNKTSVGEYFAVTLGSNDKAAAASIMTGVTSDAATVTAAKASSTAANGQTFTLTTGVDTLTGTGGNDVFNAVDEASLAAGDTLQVADTINGGSGTDTLNITATQEGAIAALNMTSIENIVIRTTGDDDDTGESFNATGYTGVERISLDRITDDFSLTGVALSTVAKVINNAGTTIDVTVDYLDTAETGTADAATIEVDAFDATSDLTVAVGVETLTIKSVGTTASTIADLDVDGVKTLKLEGTSSALTITEADAGADNETTTIVVTGANKVTVTNALSTAVTSIDASTATGGSTFDLTGLTAPTFTGGSGVDTITAVTNASTVTTGAGNDIVTLGAVVLGASSSIAGGEGTDTLVIADDTTTLFTTATKAKMSGFETLRVETVAGGNDGQVVDFDSMSGFTSLEIGDNDDLTVNDIATSVLAAGVNVLAVNTGSLVLNATDATVPGTADTLKLVLDHGTADTAVTIADLQAAGVETLTIVSSGAGTNTNSIELGTENSTLANINISGSSKFTLTTQAAADVGGVLTVAGGDATGVLTITLTGEDDGSSITTGSGADVITGGTAVDVISSGAGNDTLNISGGLDRYTGGTGVDSYKFAASYDDGDDAITISDFTAGIGGDKIMFDVSEMDTATAGLIDSLDMDAYVEGTVATIGTNTSSTAFASNSMMVITDAEFANYAAVETELKVENAGTDLTDIAVLFFNSTTGKAELYVSDTTANATYDLKVATFSSVVTLAGLADFAAQNFTEF